MSKNLTNILLEAYRPFSLNYNIKAKKFNEGSVGGVIFQFSEVDFSFEAIFGFRSEYGNQITLSGLSSFNLKIFEIENLYMKLLEKHGISSSNSRTININDYDFLSNIYFDESDLTGIQAHTQKILERFETYMLPKAEQYLSLPYWAQHYEKKKENIYADNETDSFYRHVSDNKKLKHLIILKLTNSPYFEIAFEIAFERMNNYLKESKDDKSFNAINQNLKILSDLKETLDATPAKYDYRDITPPYRFIKKVDAKPVEPKPSASEVYPEDRAVKVEINAFEISVEQQAKIDSFLKDIKKHFEAIREVIIDNAEFENEQGQLQNFEDCSYVIQDIAEAKGLLDGQKLGFERAAAQYLYLKEIAIDPDQNQVNCTVTSDFSNKQLTALLDLDGNVEIVHM